MKRVIWRNDIIITMYFECRTRKRLLNGSASCARRKNTKVENRGKTPDHSFPCPATSNRFARRTRARRTVVSVVPSFKLSPLFPTRTRERGADGPPSEAAAAAASALSATSNGRRRRPPPWSWCRVSGVWTVIKTANSSSRRRRRRPRCRADGGWASRPPRPAPRPPLASRRPGTGPGRCASNGWAWPRSCTRPPYRSENSTGGGPRPHCEYYCHFTTYIILYSRYRCPRDRAERRAVILFYIDLRYANFRLQ